ncbi:hypothetical protein GCM10023088_32500 [Actinomadura verrucosospora]|uniref:hypothetical protein n=1 Tax=Actinomadura verrucosospora TaxID=46165 RepID=UPI0031EDAC23
MPKMTDYARQGFRRRRLFQDTELPEWWNIAVWAGVGGIVLMLAVSAVLDRGDSSGAPTAGRQAPSYQVQTLDPRTLTESPSPGETPSTSASPSQVLPTGASANDFTATAAAKVPVTGGGTTVVPAGALNLATAAASATVSGNWKGIPFIGAARPSPAKKGMAPGSAVQGITVADPTRTGNSQYLFSATITRPGGARPEVVQLLVEPDERGYALRAG